MPPQNMQLGPYWLFWVRDTWKTADTRKALWPSFFFVKADKIPVWKKPFLYQEEETFLLLETGGQEKTAQKDFIKKIVYPHLL